MALPCILLLELRSFRTKSDFCTVKSRPHFLSATTVNITLPFWIKKKEQAKRKRRKSARDQIKMFTFTNTDILTVTCINKSWIDMRWLHNHEVGFTSLLICVLQMDLHIGLYPAHFGLPCLCKSSDAFLWLGRVFGLNTRSHCMVGTGKRS